MGGGSPGRCHEEQQRRSHDREAEDHRLLHARIDTRYGRRITGVAPARWLPAGFRLAEREAQRLGAGIEELDLEESVDDRLGLTDQLVHPLLDQYP